MGYGISNPWPEWFNRLVRWWRLPWRVRLRILLEKLAWPFVALVLWLMGFRPFGGGTRRY